MRGAVAAGHPLTAEAGARVLAEGGNAVDAAVAAGFTSWVTESPLTGPGAGGFILVHRARDRSTRVFDFFVAVPGLGRGDGVARDMEAVNVDFTADSTQVFKIGAASCAVPGAVAGMEAAHRGYGRLPWAALTRPAAELARSGVVMTEPQEYLHAILDVILRHTDEGRRVYGRDDKPLAAGDRLALPELADTIDLIGERGADVLYRGELAQAIVEASEGMITRRDLEDYRVVRRRPISVPFLGHVFDSNPPPSSGGILIAYGLTRLDPVGGPGSAEAIDALARAMRAQTEARDETFTRALYRGGGARPPPPRPVSRG